jgi:hypothetical protein
MQRTYWVVAVAVVAAIAANHLAAQEPSAEQDQAQRFEQFAKKLTGAKLVGHFTVTGKKSDELTAEEYHIHEVKKLDEGDYWMFKARIKYGGRDVTVPMPLEVKWADKTPVITLDSVEIPLMGKFNARVVIDGNKYAGTWSHDDGIGGHLFGEIVPNKAESGPDAEEKSDKGGQP